MVRLFRYEWVAWLVLAGLVAFSLRALPGLKLEVSLRDSFAPEHPARVAFEEYAERFHLTDDLLLFVTGREAMSVEGLRRLRRFTDAVGDLEDTDAVLSLLDLREPVNDGARLSTRQVLGRQTLADEDLARGILEDPAFRRRWAGLLFGHAMDHLLVLITPDVDHGDPKAGAAYLEAVQELARTHLAGPEVEWFWTGRFFVAQETMRATAADQFRLTGLSGLLQLLIIAALFGRLLAALQVTVLLTLSSLLGFGAMAHLGIPVNFMSGNLPIMVGVIGLADVLHILSAYARLRASYGPRGAALRAMRRNRLPLLLTTLTTLGCVALNAGSPLRILGTFSVALSLGVAVVYLVTITYGPLLFMRSGIEAGRGGVFAVQALLEESLGGDFLRRATGRRARTAWLVGGGLILGLAATQRLDTNWFRNFAPGMPVTESLDALEARGLPVSSVELTLATDRPFEQVLDDEAYRGWVERLCARLEALPGVRGVASLLDLRRGLEDSFADLRWPDTLAPRWVETRRQASYRKFLSYGAFDQYWDPRDRELRFVILTDLESSAQLLELDRRAHGVATQLAREGAPWSGGDLVSRGSMLYWSEIIAWVAQGSVVTFLGSLVVIFLCFLVVSGRVRLALLALPPNLLPVLTMLALARVLGEPVSEEFCTLSALAIGISVDDTLHLLFHYQRGRRAGLEKEAALAASLRISGAPVILTTACLVVGFLLCLDASMMPVWRTGVYLTSALVVALAADLSLLPILLLRWDRREAPGAARQYPRAAPAGSRPPPARRRGGLPRR